MVEKPEIITKYLVKIIPFSLSQSDDSLTSLCPATLTSFLCIIHSTCHVLTRKHEYRSFFLHLLPKESMLYAQFDILLFSTE